MHTHTHAHTHTHSHTAIFYTQLLQGSTVYREAVLGIYSACLLALPHPGWTCRLFSNLNDCSSRFRCPKRNFPNWWSSKTFLRHDIGVYTAVHQLRVCVRECVCVCAPHCVARVITPSVYGVLTLNTHCWVSLPQAVSTINGTDNLDHQKVSHTHTLTHTDTHTYTHHRHSAWLTRTLVYRRPMEARNECGRQKITFPIVI